MSGFEIKASPLPQDGRNEADATLSSLLIKVNDHVVSEFVDQKGHVSKTLQLPAYFLAEWIAENWWPLLWEPRKSEDDGDDAGFLSRHSFLSAQHGYALPKVSIVALGKSLEILALPRQVPIADVKFRNRAHITCSRDVVEGELRDFVQSIVQRLEEARISDTWLQDTWTLISETDSEEAQFCRFAGALGLSPYDVDEKIGSLIEQLLPTLGDRLLMDLCLVSSAAQFPTVAGIAEQAMAMTRDVSASTLSPIASLPVPKENLGLPAYRRGVQAADFLRRRLGIKDLDVGGASRVFEILQVDTSAKSTNSQTYDHDDVAVTGAVVRNHSEMKIAMLQQKESKRRFAGARAIFSAWSSESPNEIRLLTSAVTRDQQANRAFAAELTAPKSIIRSRAKNGRLSLSGVFDLAAELQIGADVVKKQALNNGIMVSPI